MIARSAAAMGDGASRVGVSLLREADGRRQFVASVRAPVFNVIFKN